VSLTSSEHNTVKCLVKFGTESLDIVSQWLVVAPLVSRMIHETGLHVDGHHFHVDIPDDEHKLRRSVHVFQKKTSKGIRFRCKQISAVGT